MMYVVFEFVCFVNDNEIQVNTSILNTDYES